ncbi:hypothetical protein [Cohnella silvisoli]|uniref:Uncharacterized protein n=1 Tax=Cohnella silvisoli TaxID=2873699 RepID=A0ABV1L1C9_9BACL|nr:hypothetical protein [Cohnella silvisoli]MCD9025448.1 hypothetical protein [Cohnella silvisoli]
MKRILPLILVVCMLSVWSSAGVASSAQSNKEISALFLKENPKLKVKEIKSEDLNNDKMKEYYLLDDEGQFWIYQNQKFRNINCCYYSDDDLEPAHIIFLKQNSKEKHVLVSFEYYPSNASVAVFRLKKDKLEEILNLQGDRGVFIKGQSILMQWKKYRNEGGWDEIATIYIWNNTKKKYEIKSSKPNGYNSDNFME